MGVVVNVDNFARAETHRMMRDLQQAAGGVNRFDHRREPAAIDKQTVIRMNRDTLYSSAIVDVTGGATLSIPEHGNRYLSAMVVNEEHYVNAVFHEPGRYELTQEQFGSAYVQVVVRILVSPDDPEDVATVAALQDRIGLEAGSSTPFAMPDYDQRSLDETREALLALARNLTEFEGAFGAEGEVDPVRHLIGTAAGFGGLPATEARYIHVEPQLPVGQHELTVGEVPVDGFWSVTVYNAHGFFEPNDRDSYSVNNLTGAPNPDGTITIRFGDYPPNVPNAIPTPEGWNYAVRLYRPRAEILDGRWVFPSLRE
ncbi:DUF1214 domain-containing protein [Leifsonia virtsii]|uniref:DUF1214 domain-containing protein n=1 Tax=Leifsonia virtsii TaxID=3035915 RepID=A0ABT8J286_9MICO|nr:DUF1214 domain-containing protein [Leifsonia virtsii]MDN4599077.1 DUF1214 domain-containing protein [Leifsonia virtsii]